MPNLILTILTFCVVNGHYHQNLTETERIDTIEKIINEFKISMPTYKPPVDNSRFKPTSEDINSFGRFDFIIVGAGSAGSALAARLSEIKRFQVLLVEAGQEEGEFSKIPAAMSAIINSPMDWGYKTTPQVNSCLAEPGQRCNYPRGLALGGSSSINAMTYVRGNAHEYNLWGNQHKGWSYRDLLPYFKKSERTQMDDIDRFYHGYYGPLNVERNQHHWLVDTLLSASKSLNHQYNHDYNGRTQLGTTVLQETTLNGVRHSANTAYLAPIRHRRENLKILTGAYVTKIITKTTDGSVRAVGVEFSWRSKKWEAMARKEVVLSAGSVNTPHILFHSGIGPSNQLSQLGIPLVTNVPAIGQNLADHPALFSIHCTTNLTDSDKSIREHIADYVKGIGNLATVRTHVINFIQLDLSHDRFPDVELMLNPANNALLRYLTDPGYVDPSGPGATVPLALDILTMLMHPKSRGSVTIVSADPYDFPQIDPRLLFHADDLEAMLNTVFKAIEFLDTDEFKRIDVKINLAVAPLACGVPNNITSRDYWTCYVKHQTTTLFHPMGTCRMGDVVDAQLRVKGVKSLRIADASVIPITVAGHTNPICIVIGEKAADLIKGDWT